jgi:hypothetical protein
MSGYTLAFEAKILREQAPGLNEEYDIIIMTFNK